MDNVRRWLIVIAVFFSVMFVLSIVGTVSSTLKYKSYDCETEATVLSKDSRTRRQRTGKHYTTVHEFRYEYCWETEEEICYDKTSWLSTRLDIGSEITIRYDSTNPENHMLRYEVSENMFAGFVLAIVMLILSVGAFIQYFRVRAA